MYFLQSHRLSREGILRCIPNLLVIFFSFTVSLDAKKRFDVHGRYTFYVAACLLTFLFFPLFLRFSLNVSKMENPFPVFFFIILILSRCSITFWVSSGGSFSLHHSFFFSSCQIFYLRKFSWNITSGIQLIFISFL